MLAVAARLEQRRRITSPTRMVEGVTLQSCAQTAEAIITTGRHASIRVAFLTLFERPCAVASAMLLQVICKTLLIRMRPECQLFCNPASGLGKTRKKMLSAEGYLVPKGNPFGSVSGNPTNRALTHHYLAQRHPMAYFAHEVALLPSQFEPHRERMND